MSKTRLEKRTESDGNRHAKRCGVAHKKMNGPGYNSWPDQYYIGTKNRDLYVEYKRVGKEPTTLQADTHEMLRKRGKKVLVVDDNNLQEAYDAISALVA